MRRNEYLDNLRTIIQHSANVLSAQVKDYIYEMVHDPSEDGLEILLKENRPLIDHLASNYVDALLQHLLPSDRNQYDDNTWGLYRLGIRDDLRFFPPSPVRPPFIPLLNANEDEGLRLINMLADRSVARWAANCQHPILGHPPLHPLPIRIRLSSGEREFWGDEHVYLWFRPPPISGGNHVVTSALMALEWWMEQQIETGRSPDELFEKVLSSGKCVALIGVCLSVATAYPEQCLRAAFPLVASPAAWKMDMTRWTHDRQDNKMPDLFGKYDFFSQIQEVRNNCPQRSRNIWHLAGVYLFGNDISMREPFQRALSGFHENLPFQFEEDKNDAELVKELAEEVEEFQVWGVRENVKLCRLEDGQILIQPELPDHIKARREARVLKAHPALQQWRLDLWAKQSLKLRRAAEGMTIEGAYRLASGMGRVEEIENLSAPPEDFAESELFRLRAMIKAAMTIAVISADSASDEIHNWYTQVLLAASRIQTAEHYFADHLSDARWEIKSFAARGIAALAVRPGGEAELRKRVLRLSIDTAVTEGVFSGLHPGWKPDPVLCWNALSLLLAVCLKPRREERVNWDEPWEEIQARYEQTARIRLDELLQQHLKNLDEGIIPDLPEIPLAAPYYFQWDVAPLALGWLPLDLFLKDEPNKGRLLRLNDNLVAWTIHENSPGPPDRHGNASYRHTGTEWNLFFPNWSVTLTRFLLIDEARKHLITPLLDCLESAPILLADFLARFVVVHFAHENPPTSDALALWNEISAAVLERSKKKLRSRTIYGPYYLDDILALLIFIRQGGTLLNDQWRHAKLFIPSIDQWVETAGTNADRYSGLLILLEVHAKNFGVKTTLGWLSQMTPAADHDFWRQNDNGNRTGEILAHLWATGNDQIGGDSELLTAYSRLVDRLVIAGVPVANVLQHSLETRRDG